MPGRLNGEALERLRAIASGGNPSDEALVSRFVSRGDDAEDAFAALVDRHGPAVFRACRAMLGEEQSAQDAFQATFLVLARKAGTLRVADSVQPWLLAVAVRVSASSRAAEARRRRHEGRRFAVEVEARPSGDPAERREVVELVRDEVARLPDHLRAAVVACDLEGLGHEQAARRLGWPIGTVKSRQARGRERLKSRLARRGLSAAPIAIRGGLETRLVVPGGLVRGTVRAALATRSGVRLAGAVPASVGRMVRSEGGSMTAIFHAAAVGTVLLGAWAVALGPGGGGQEDEPAKPEVGVQEVGAGTRPRGDQPPGPPAPVELEAIALAGVTQIAARDDQGELIGEHGAAGAPGLVGYEMKSLPLSMVAVVGAFEQRALQEAIREGGEGRAVVAYRRVDLERQRLGEDGAWSPWEPIDPEQSRELVLDVAFEMEDWTPQELRNEVLVAWIPYLEGWRDDEFRLIAERFRDRRLNEALAPRGNGMMGRPEGSPPPHVREPWLTIRAVDLTVEPGESYRYRVRVVIDDPRGGLPGMREVAGEWSEPVGPVRAAAISDRAGQVGPGR
ncbi:RNA polymerase sigma factor [Tautonia plasticadhaerens]|uniref:ECF RNA polymerase sigma factor SigE n=1 Tax=Tautonia plasticadhaerens TaxID=2527974 RepID=A0A518HAP0_9BACT|nr:RNA polymerase sigma factor [Tautonia plasticadhaerens]QDV37920.1 ECF RNA polymerase sigma factor SigE [Tautonia plasticadhaerens]